MRLFLIVVLAAFQFGCVVFPITRTYFEPNLEDGKAQRSSSCGYNRTAHDSLERDVDDLHVLVSPSYQEGRQLSVTFLFRFPSGDTGVRPELFELYSLSDGKTYKPVDIRNNVYGPDKTHPYTSIWVHLKYPVISENLESIKFVFPVDSITRNDLSVNLAPFRFNKVKKSDVYYGSINC